MSISHAGAFVTFLQLIEKQTGVGGYEVRGRIERVDETTLSITELQVKKWTQDYKQFLETMLTGDGKTPPEIKDFKENHTDTTVSFTIIADKEVIDKFEKDKNGLYGKFKLAGSLSTANMHLFDTEGKMVKYANPMEILNPFYTLRLDYYNRRKEALVKKIEYDQRMLSNKARFVEEVCAGDLVVSNRKRREILADLQQRGYDLIQKEETKKDDGDSEDEGAAEESTDAELAKGYEYLLGMKIWSLTYEKAEALRAEFAEKTAELNLLKGTSPSQIWLNDLDAIEAALDVRDSEMELAAADEKKAQLKSQKRRAEKLRRLEFETRLGAWSPK
jgi:DNA topoisomerase-2